MSDVTVVGIGADGWAGLSEPGREAARSAEVLLGSRRQLDLLPDEVKADRVPWPSPLLAALHGLLDAHRDRRVCVLASGDPMFHGIGSTVVKLLGAGRVTVLPRPSSASLACAHLGWPLDTVEVVSAVGRPVTLLHPALHPGRRVIVLSADGATPAAVAALLDARGYGDSELTVLEQLGGPGERVVTGLARDHWPVADPLNVVAVHCRGTALVPTVPGLPDDAYLHDGQLTKREARAVTLARLQPVPGQLLWDVGAGAGSIAIEWSRAHRACRAIAVEADSERVSRIGANAQALGVPYLSVVEGRAPEALDGLDPPDAVFVGGGVTAPGMLEACWAALLPGGRLVVNAVTLESERLVAEWHARVGGDLARIAIQRAAPIGGFTGWRPLHPVTQWTVVK